MLVGTLVKNLVEALVCSLVTVVLTEGGPKGAEGLSGKRLCRRERGEGKGKGKREKKGRTRSGLGQQ
jgi:hypothetical protein